MDDVIATTAGSFPPITSDHPARATHLQETMGFDRIVGHRPSWTGGILEPVASHPNVTIDGGPAPIPRVHISGELDPQHALRDGLDIDPDKRMIVLPDPYTLATACDGQYFATDEERLAAFSDYLLQELALAPDHRTLLLLAPALVSHQPSDGMDARCSAAIDRLTTVSDAAVILASFGDGFSEKVHAHLLDADIDAIGYDLVRAREHSRELITEYGSTDSVALGVLDPGVGVTETVLDERIDTFVGSFDVQEFTTTYAMPAGPLHTLSWKALEMVLEPLAQLGN